MKLKGKISELLIKKFNLALDKDYDISFIDAKKLFVLERIDLVAKYQYVEALNKKLDTNFFYEQYKATIEAFSNGKFYEPGDKDKNSFKKFDDIFKKLIEDISKKGFDKDESVVPVAESGVIMDGAHRVAISAFLNEKVPVVKIENGECCFDYKFFRNRMLDEKYLDNMVFKYAEMKDNIYVVCLWPTCSKNQQKEISEYINGKFKVVYEKDVDFSYNGLKNFMSQVYYEQDWIGDLENGYKGVQAKVNLCYKDGRPTHIIVIEEKDIDKIVKEKANIRKKIGIGNHSIHSTDDHVETMRMLSLVLNENSIKFLNKSDPYKYKYPTRELRKIKTELEKRHIPVGSIVIDSGSVLALYGLRPSDDIDVLIDNKYLEKGKDFLDLHNEGIDFYKTSLDDLLYNPDNYFYYEGIKVMSPERLLIMKKNRVGKKDLEDVKRLLSLLDKKQSKLLVFKTTVRRKMNHAKYRTATVVVPMLKKTGTYDWLKKIIYRGKR